MKILKCHIENFGKLSNFDYEFKDGLNTIKEENGFGKTTFASFIKAMFYGMESKKNTKILIDRKKYVPWQGGAFGGSIDFEVNNKQYRIERFFEKKEADDTFKLYDLSTNLETNEYSQNIGEEIFKLNKEAYDRSTFISGQNIETSMNDSINAKLGNILENENDVNTSEQAIKQLDEAIKNYKKTGGRGEINEKIGEKTKLEQKLEQSRVDEKTLQSWKDKNEEVKKLLKSKNQEKEQLNKLLTSKIEQETRITKIDNYKTLQNNVANSQKTLEEYEQFFKDEIPTDEEIDTLIEKCLSLERYKTELKNYEISTSQSQELQDLKGIFQDKPISEEIINKKISECNEIKDIQSKIDLNEEKISNLNKEKEELHEKLVKQKKVNLVLCMCSIIVIIIATAMLIHYEMQISLPVITVGIIGIVGLVITLTKMVFVRGKNTKYLDKEKEIDEISANKQELEHKLNNLQKGITELIENYSMNNELDNIIQLTEIKAKFVKYKEFENSVNITLKKQKEICQKLNDLEESIKEYLLKYFKELNKSYVTYAQEIKIKKSEFKRIMQEHTAKQKEKEDYKIANNIEELEKIEQEEADSTLNQFDKKEIEEKVNDLSNEINKLNDEKNYNKNHIEALESNLEAVFDIENDLEELDQNLEEMKQNCKILEKTKKYLETAKEQFSSRYLGGMREDFIKNLDLINGKEMEINLDVNLNVQINEQGSNKDLNYFSTGYKDLIYICMRLSLIDALFKDEKPFIILDDPFVNLDEAKIENATNLIKSISSKYQIIYFVCHESRM